MFSNGLLINDLEVKKNKLHSVELESGLKPFINMLNMDISIDKLIKHIKLKSKIRVIGDYDTDGILATTTIISLFRDHPLLQHIEISYFIPDRMKHGYGVSPLIVEEAKKDGIDLIITVDNGISAFSAIDKAIELGIDVIITDHHTVPKIIPNIDTIVNPKMDNNLEFNEISGATVAYCFCEALNKRLDIELDLYYLLDLAAITVLSDVMPLENINRPLLEHGFKSIENSKREVYNKVFSKEQRTNLTSSDISFNLVPKINATGRLANANLGVQLFLDEEIDDVLSKIENINEDRKDITHKQLQLILKDADDQNSKYNCIVVYNDKLHEGVVGILASRLVELYKKPSFVLTKHHGNEYKGSARSLGKISVYNLLTKQQHLLQKFGGHAGAAGLGLLKENIDLLRQEMSNDLQENYTQDDYFQEVYHYELEHIGELTYDIAKTLQCYEPFGSHFEKPGFKLNLKITSIEKNIKDKHYKCIIRDKFMGKKEVWFYHFNEDMNLYLNKPINVMIDFGLNFWNGHTSLVYRGKIIND